MKKKDKKVRKKWFLYDDFGNKISFKNLKVSDYWKAVYLPKYLSFFRWIVIDWWRGKPEKLFGIWMFCGLFGEGKTISMVKYAEELKRKMPDISIYTNFGYVFENGPIVSIDDILATPHRSIVIIDEIQNSFESSKWKSFPSSLLTEITQCRKKELMIMCSAQVYSRVSVQIRDLAQFIIVCQNFGKTDRLFRNKFFNSIDYERYYSAVKRGDKQKVQPFMRRSYVVNDDFYTKYKTTAYANVLE